MGKGFRTLTLIGAVTCALLLNGCSSDDKDKAKEPRDTGLSVDEISNEAFKDKFPLHYKSYEENKEESDTKYSGSIRRSKFDADKEPYLPILFNGFAFALDYKEDRGHVYALEDIKNTMRITDKSPGGCITCKSTAVPKLQKESNNTYYKESFNSVYEKAEKMGQSPVGCSDCHNPKTMELRITRQPFVDAMKDRGIDVSKATKNEMRSYVCAQCHVEYYFRGEEKTVVFPWKNGLSAEDMYKYYESERNVFPADFTSGISGTPILKAQHPDYENTSLGQHAKAGVSCSDCHMPYHREGGKKFSSHKWESPLKDINAACRTCHNDQSKADLKAKILEIQDMHMNALHKAEDISVKAHYYVNKMITVGAPAAKIKEAQEHIRKGQWFWDFVAAENSAGFHNPQGQMNNLMISSNESNAALKIATEELAKKNVDLNKLDHDIEAKMKAVFDEKESTKKKDHATDAQFPSQAAK